MLLFRLRDLQFVQNNKNEKKNNLHLDFHIRNGTKGLTFLQINLDGRQSLMDEELGWKRTSNGRWPSTKFYTEEQILVTEFFMIILVQSQGKVVLFELTSFSCENVSAQYFCSFQLTINNILFPFMIFLSVLRWFQNRTQNTACSCSSLLLRLKVLQWSTLCH